MWQSIQHIFVYIKTYISFENNFKICIYLWIIKHINFTIISEVSYFLCKIQIIYLYGSAWVHLKNDRMISVHFQGKPFSIRIIQVYAPTHGVAKSWTRLSNFTFTFHFHALEKEMAAHSSVLALRIPGTGKPGGLPSVGLHRVRHDWSDLAAAEAACPNQ